MFAVWTNRRQRLFLFLRFFFLPFSYTYTYYFLSERNSPFRTRPDKRLATGPARYSRQKLSPYTYTHNVAVTCLSTISELKMFSKALSQKLKPMRCSTKNKIYVLAFYKMPSSWEITYTNNFYMNKNSICYFKNNNFWMMKPRISTTLHINKRCKE